MKISPYSTSIIFRGSDNSRAIIVESARENFFFMSFQDLFAGACFHVPESHCGIRAARHQRVAFRVETNFWNFSLMSFYKINFYLSECTLLVMFWCYIFSRSDHLKQRRFWFQLNWKWHPISHRNGQWKWQDFSRCFGYPKVYKFYQSKM